MTAAYTIILSSSTNEMLAVNISVANQKKNPKQCQREAGEKVAAGTGRHKLETKTKKPLMPLGWMNSGFWVGSEGVERLAGYARGLLP